MTPPVVLWVSPEGLESAWEKFNEALAERLSSKCQRVPRYCAGSPRERRTS